MNSRRFITFLAVAVVLLHLSAKFGEAQGESSATQGGDELTKLAQNAARGDARSQYQIGLAYMAGSSVPQDYPRAAKYCEEAAAQGLADAAFALGYLYEHG